MLVKTLVLYLTVKSAVETIEIIPERAKTQKTRIPKAMMNGTSIIVFVEERNLPATEQRVITKRIFPHPQMIMKKINTEPIAKT